MIDNAIFLAKSGGRDVPDKNTRSYEGVKSYELIFKKLKPVVKNIFVSTNIEEIKNSAERFDFNVIDRPANLCTVDARLDDAIAHCVARIEAQGKLGEICGIFMGNAPFIPSIDLIEAEKILRQKSDFDSIVSVGQFPMFAPERARKINSEGKLVSYVESREALSNSCDRSAHLNCYFANGSFTLVRSEVLKNIKNNPPPFPWQGENILPYIQEPGVGDIDAQWQLPVSDWWVKKYMN